MTHPLSFMTASALLKGYERMAWDRAVAALPIREMDSVITKSEHADLRGDFNRAFAGIWQAVVSEPFCYAGRFKNLTEAEYAITSGMGHGPEIHTAARWLKKVEAATAAAGPARDAALRVLTFVAPIAARVEALKAKIGVRAKVKTAAQVAKEATQMTCQICGRGIFAETGRIAHHGYTRPWEGYQTASCEGARELPFEVTNAALQDHIHAVGSQMVALQAHIREVEAERRGVAYAWTSKERIGDKRFGKHLERRSTVTRENFDEVMLAIAGEMLHPSTIATLTFDRVKTAELRRLNGRLEGMRQYHAEQLQRCNAWKPTHRRQGDAWVALAA